MNELIGVLVVAGIIFGICFLVDKLYMRIFRNAEQYRSGMSVRLNKRYGSIGLLIGVLGIAGIFAGLSESVLLIVGGAFLTLVGTALVIYYLSFGVYYDARGFIRTAFWKKSRLYRYSQIQCQQLFVNGSQIIVELHMDDGRAVQLQPAMKGAAEFLDYAYARWKAEKGLCDEDCAFHDTNNSCWFPPAE